MNARLFIYGIWCLLISGGYLAASFVGYSPFADGGRAPVRSGIYGPNHK